MKRFRFRFMVLALTGLLLNFGVHLKVILSPAFVILPLYHLLMLILTVGLFIVCLPATLAMSELMSRGRAHQDFWKVAFHALPSWTRVLVWIIILYGFALGGVQSSMRIRNLHTFQSSQQWVVWQPRVESGQYISFYCIAATILYTRWRR